MSVNQIAFVLYRNGLSAKISLAPIRVGGK